MRSGTRGEMGFAVANILSHSQRDLLPSDVLTQQELLERVHANMRPSSMS
ncbi:hypothetical protein CIHG_10268 [Coccidioides immitis H538.4]|uniref:Uncharacterized protein n=2 Tax=Coccidioides immitis TaxID=5501 RepID=A0A0J8S809_COCIT|nr:hypothetical protein CIRG_10369 [Coccidioides immitis RMSCC 2394]KMU92524.1 hypothetical protein CIHG_10268 [Coccidioides immitis H538.4]